MDFVCFGVSVDLVLRATGIALPFRDRDLERFHFIQLQMSIPTSKGVLSQKMPVGWLWVTAVPLFTLVGGNTVASRLFSSWHRWEDQTPHVSHPRLPNPGLET